MNPDVVIIGGGIVGCACAYFLAKAGIKVHLVEKGALGSGASKAGMMHVVSWEEPDIHLHLSHASKRLYQELSQVLPIDIEFRETGSIAIVETPESFETLAKTIKRLQAYGVNCQMLNPEELIEFEPNIAPDIAGAGYFMDDGQVNPLSTTLALAQAARSYHATIEPFNPVVGFELSPDGATVQAVVTAQGRIPTQSVVLASGAWTREIGEKAGLDIPIQPRKGTLVVTVPVPNGLINCKVILAAGYMDSVHSGDTGGVTVAANIQQAVNGNLVLGSSRQFVSFDRRVDPHVVASMMSRCLRFFPCLADISAIRTWAGFRPYTPDLLPIISPVEQIRGIYIAAGHEGIGITEAPITGKLISQLITGQIPDISLEKVAFSRFKAAQPA